MATILIVDDNPSMRFLLRRVLHDEGHTTLEAENGQVALQQLAIVPTIELLVVDIEMPVMNGLELLRALSYRTTLPKLVLSACDPAPPLVDLDVRGYFSKPVELSKFKKTVRRLLPLTPTCI